MTTPPTDKQIQFIQEIQRFISEPFNPQTQTKTEATSYISRNIELYVKRRDSEIHAMTDIVDQYDFY